MTKCILQHLPLGIEQTNSVDEMCLYSATRQGGYPGHVTQGSRDEEQTMTKQTSRMKPPTSEQRTTKEEP